MAVQQPQHFVRFSANEKQLVPTFCTVAVNDKVISVDSYHVLLEPAAKHSWTLVVHQHPVKQWQNIGPPTLVISRHACLSYKHLQGTNPQPDTCIYLPLVYTTIE